MFQKRGFKLMDSSDILNCIILITIKVGMKAKIKNRYNQVPHLTRNTIWESDKNTRKHHTQEPFPSR